MTTEEKSLYQVLDGVDQPIEPGSRLLYVTTNGPRICVVESIKLEINRHGTHIRGIYVRRPGKNRASYLSRIWNPKLYLVVGKEGDDKIVVPEKVEAVLVGSSGSRY